MEIDLKPENYPNAVDPYNIGSNKPVEAGVLSTSDFDATEIDPVTVTLGDPLLAGTVSAVSVCYEDINGDGLLDVVFSFGQARDFADAGALDAESTDVLLLGSTWDGLLDVWGFDAVVIVGN